jgi:thioredoxin 1
MQEIKNSNFNPSDHKVALVDFWAEWCMPCKMLLPVVTKLSNEILDVAFFKANVEENIELAKSINVTAVPLMVIYKDGKVFEKLVGLLPEANIREALSRAVA